jgi:glycosyl transferase family 25
MKLIDFFDRIYIVNLPNRTDRLREMTAELAKVDIALASETVEVFPAIRPESPGPFKSIGARGAFLSHLSILKKARDQGLRKVLIMEDDLEFRPDFLQYESVLIDELSTQNWDIAHFGYCSSENPLTFDLPILNSFAGEIRGAQFYAVGGQALDELITFLETLLARPDGHPEGGPMPVDGAFNVYKWQYPHRVRLIAVPSFGGQRSSRSDITPKWFDSVPGVSTLAKTLRNLAVYKKFKRFQKRSPTRPAPPQ